LEQIYDDLDDVDVYLSTAGGFAQPLEEWNKNKDGFRFSNLYDADLNWKLRLKSDIRSLKQYMNILNVMSPILDHIQGFGWKVCEIESTKGNIHHRDALFTSILFEFKKI
jgi:hypothetical protein